MLNVVKKVEKLFVVGFEKGKNQVLLEWGGHLAVEVVVLVQSSHHAIQVALVYEVDGVVVHSMM